MLLYKSRDFSTMFQDTFAYLKQNGQHFFKHFFIINGIFLLILLVLGYFLMQFYTQLLFGNMSGGNSPMNIDQFMNDNGGFFALIVIAFLIIGLFAGMISYAFTPIYLGLHIKNGSQNFGTSEIIAEYKRNVTKLIIYLLSAILIGIPIVFVLVAISFMMILTIIGILGIPIVIGAFTLFYTMALMEYLESDKGIWDCFGYSWTLLASKFWPAVGCVSIFYLISYLVQNIITLIAYVFGLLKMLTGIDSNAVNQEDISSTFTIVMMIAFFLGFILSAVLNTVVLLNQGIVFYSLKEEKEHINTKSIIDQIGSGE